MEARSFSPAHAAMMAKEVCIGCPLMASFSTGSNSIARFPSLTRAVAKASAPRNKAKRLLLDRRWESKFAQVTTAIEAIYEDGVLRPLQPLALPEHAHVRVSVETLPDDAQRAAWLAQSERRLRQVWDNEADDVFNELLAR